MESKDNRKEYKAELSLMIDNVRASVSWEYTDLDIRELYDAFKGLLVAHTFTAAGCDRYIVEEAESIKDSEIYNNGSGE